VNQTTINLRRTLPFRWLMLAGLALAAAQAHPAAAAEAAVATASVRERSELKLIVPADRVAAAIATLRLTEKTPAPLEVVFFDTKDAALQAKNFILRVRHKAGTPGDSTVKIRITAGEGTLSDVEQAIPPDLDWTSAEAPSVSRSLNHKLPPDQYNAVLGGGASPATLFSGKQRRLVEARIPSFPWTALYAHGPVQAEVWDRQCKLKGFPKPVTVEHWHLRKGELRAEILEVSVKVTASSEAEAKAQAAVFFQAAEDAGFGRPSGQSKTQIVLDFFRPAP
jgi:hypothetical protein